MNAIRENCTSTNRNLVHRNAQLMRISGSSTQPTNMIPTVRLVSSGTRPIKAVNNDKISDVPREASTEFHKSPDALYSIIEAIFWAGREECFEDGLQSTFSKTLESLVKECGKDALEVITILIVYERVEPEVASEALRWLGRIEHLESYEYRRWLLERSLSSFSSRVRDGALLGLSSMDDKRSIKHLKVAISRETNSELEADMKSLVEQLES